MKSAKGKIIVGMSGGVDSSTATFLLKEEGYEVIGLFMRTVPEGCCGGPDAGAVAQKVGIEYHEMDCAAEFAEMISCWTSEYLRGRTPNPCVMCNERLRFVKLREFAKEHGAEKIATGHYARIVKRRTGRYHIARAKDLRKDQSYFLYAVAQEELAPTIFPNGTYTKKKIRQIAAEVGIPVAEKPDSQDICFIRNSSYADFLKECAPEASRPGPIVDTKGNVLGEHPGIAFFTVGQRRGLGIAGGVPYYVIRLEAETNTVVVGKKPETYAREFWVEEMKWMADPEAADEWPKKWRVAIRSTQRPRTAEVFPEPDYNRLRVVYQSPVRAITPGQSAVLYERDLVIAGGLISRVGPSVAKE
ncbi:MAG: tRNA 2-thiouridine(34) synthase MnmA [Planctomycetota bacterium]|nr:MAG: tRNA 2-thiouridine(34) synthase MnmA [Planctomycetota bacterium]